MLREWTQVYGPLLVLLDDFDRADVLSWLLLARVAEQPGLAVLVVTAMRPDDGIFATPGIGQVCLDPFTALPAAFEHLAFRCLYAPPLQGELHLAD